MPFFWNIHEDSTVTTKCRLFIAMIICLCSAVTVANAAARVGEKFGDWLFQCQALAANKTACVITQTLIQQETSQRVLRMTLSKLKGQKKLTMVVITPLGIYIPAGVSAKTDNGHTIPMVLKFCDQKGCVASAKLDEKQRNAIESGNIITISFAQKDKNKSINLDVSLEGVTAGLKEIN
ncbi:MAG: invasion associated locus B family protein [Gammaproteobacteria bacterium]|nr:invasion associated locus B family protein [Gammaproteobacteria bacterium]